MIFGEVDTKDPTLQEILRLLQEFRDYYLQQTPRDRHGAGSTPRGVVDDPIYTTGAKISTKPSQGTVSVGTTSGIVVGGNQKRISIYIQNVSTSQISLGFGAAVAAGAGITLNAASAPGAGDGGLYIEEQFLGEIHAIATPIAGTLSVVEYSIE